MTQMRIASTSSAFYISSATYNLYQLHASVHKGCKIAACEHSL